MPALVSQRCLHHPDREAIARCPECSRFFCRECITEHEDRIICASCLQRLTAKEKEPKRKSRFWPMVFPTVKGLTGLLIGWIFFYMMGHLLLSIPSKFHDKLWRDVFHQSDDD